jgi:hypothetical protein
MCQASSTHVAGGRVRSCDKASCPSLLIKQSTSGKASDEPWTARTGLSATRTKLGSIPPRQQSGKWAANGDLGSVGRPS